MEDQIEDLRILLGNLPSFVAKMNNFNEHFEILNPNRFNIGLCACCGSNDGKHNHSSAILINKLYL